MDGNSTLLRPAPVPSPTARRLVAVFNGLFATSHGTVVLAAAGDPEYLPRVDPEGYDEIRFAHGFAASILHEVAHWCVAGPARRRQPDFGYWYLPDGRSMPQQAAFEQVEVRPQALEWVFTVAAGRTFAFSTDNLAGGGAASPADFMAAVAAEARRLVTVGLPARAARFAAAIAREFGTGDRYLDPVVYQVEA